MSLLIRQAGLQTTLQAAPRAGLRHMGVPASGPADPLSMALANRLVSNHPQSVALELTYGNSVFEAIAELAIAVTGAPVALDINGHSAPFHETLFLKTGDMLRFGGGTIGARTYLAFGGALNLQETLGSVSTYLPAALGGIEGRSLKPGDALTLSGSVPQPLPFKTPHELRPTITNSFGLRACPGAEFGALSDKDQARFFAQTFTVSRRADRMGLALEGDSFAIGSDGKMKSAAVFPGTVQCPEDGKPFLLSCDAQTTGGYPRLASVARCDRHLIGQLRPGDRLQFLRRTPQAAADELAAKSALFGDWLPGFHF